MAHSSAKSRLFTTLSHPTRSRTSSPNIDEYATAASNGSASFDINNDHILHSTIDMGGNNKTTQQQQLPLNYDEHPSFHYAESEQGSEDMSIELGRGAKRDARARANEEDMSSNLVFNFGGDSQYEITATPPISRIVGGSARKSDGGLRRDASVRNASASAKRAVSGPKPRTLSETLSQMNVAEEDITKEYTQHTATFNTRNTRFTRSRQVSAQEQPAPSRHNNMQLQQGTPRRAATTGNPTVQSATYTANSFALPNLPNITELVSGVRKDGTPTFDRATKSRSRFTSGSYKPSQFQHAPVEGLPIPEEEKAIYASLQLLKDKVAELESAKAETEMRAEEYENEIISLRSQLQAERRRPDSALGSDDEAGQDAKVKRLQANVKALQDRLDRSERKVAVSEIATKRVTNERDELVTQIGVAYFNNEELKAENEMLKERLLQFDGENAELRARNEELENGNQALKELLGSNRPQRNEASGAGKRQYARRDLEERSPERKERTFRSRKESKAAQSVDREARRKSVGPVEPESHEDVATKVAREVQKHREEAMASREVAHLQRSSSARNPSASQQRRLSASAGTERRSSAHKRAASAPTEPEVSDAGSTTEKELTKATKGPLQAMHFPSPAKPKTQPKQPLVREDDSRDITMLSWQDPLEVAELRRKIEEDYRAGRLSSKRTSSAPEAREKDETLRSMSGALPRKSSLKDITAGLFHGSENGTGRFSLGGGENAVEEAAKGGKTVRVQSPHSSQDPSVLGQQQQQPEAEAGDISILSNTSRRRRARAASAESGITSAFILPDITLGGDQLSMSAAGTKSCIAHNSAACTLCHSTRPKDFEIPTPIPVTDRPEPEDPDITTATIRPSQPPPVALATVIKNLEDEVKHLKLQLLACQQRYHAHDPALSKRQRVLTKQKMQKLTAEIEKRSNQVYALYDVLEGQKEAAKLAAEKGEEAGLEEEEAVEETLMSIGLDPAEISGRIGRGVSGRGASGKGGFEKGGFGFDGAVEDGTSGGDSADEDLPWEGLSDYESEDGVEMGRVGGEKRRSAAF